MHKLTRLHEIRYKKNKHQIKTLLRLTIRDAAPESHQVRPESLETFKPSYASSKVKNKNDAIRNRISDLDNRHISQPKPNKQTSHE